MSITVYHNPDCGTSRNVLRLIRYAGLQPDVIEYLNTPPSRETLKQLIADAGLTARSILRRKGTPYYDLGLDDASIDDETLLDTALAHPILINRPLVRSTIGVRLCRPSDVVVDLLSVLPTESILKDDGAPFLRDIDIQATDPGLVKALSAAGLAVEDLGESGICLYSYDLLDGTRVGFGGYHIIDDHVLLRSIVVYPDKRNTGIGRNLVLLLLYRAFMAGARTAWLFSTSAASFFEKTGFQPTSREGAPSGILATHQARSLCPKSAVLLSRTIDL